MLGYGPKTKRDVCTVQNFHFIEERNVKELQYIDPYSKVSTNRSLIVFPFENLFEKIHWCRGKIGYGGGNLYNPKLES